MTDQIDTKLSGILNSLQKSGAEAILFGKEQLPEVIEQEITYQKAYSTWTLIASIFILLIFSGIGGWVDVLWGCFRPRKRVYF